MDKPLILRGGGWHDYVIYWYSSFRYRHDPTNHFTNCGFNDVGFRLILIRK